MTLRPDHEHERPRWSRRKKVLVALFSILAVAVFAVGWQVIAAFAARPNIAVNYHDHLLALSDEQQTPGDNGWHVITEAAGIMDKVEAELLEAARSSPGRPRLDLKAALNGLASEEEMAVVGEALAMLEERGPFDVLDRLQSYEYFLDETPYDLALPVFSRPNPGRDGIRQLARAQLLTLRDDMASGHKAAILRTVERILGCARAIAFQPTLSDRLVTNALVRSVNDELRMGLIDDRL